MLFWAERRFWGRLNYLLPIQNCHFSCFQNKHYITSRKELKHEIAWLTYSGSTSFFDGLELGHILKDMPKGTLALTQNLVFPTRFQGSVLKHKEITEKLANIFWNFEILCFLHLTCSWEPLWQLEWNLKWKQDRAVAHICQGKFQPKNKLWS